MLFCFSNVLFAWLVFIKVAVSIESLFFISFLWLFLFACFPLKEYAISSEWIGLDALSIVMVLISQLVMIGMTAISRGELIISLKSTILENKKIVEQIIIFVVCNRIAFFIVRRWLEFYFLFECVLLPTMLLIMKGGGQIERYQASMLLVIYTGAASLPLLLTLLWWSYSNSKTIFVGRILFKDIYDLRWWSLFIILPFLVKLPVYLVHGWLPKAHVEAPLSGSILLAGLLLKFGGYGIIRVMWFLNTGPCKCRKLLLWLSLWGGVLRALVCLTHSDIKAIVAYSSIRHIGLSVSAILTMQPIGKMGAVFVMFAHGLCSPSMFCLVSSLRDVIKSRNSVLRTGLLRIMPLWSFLWCFFSIANMGVPPSINFYSELICIWSVAHLSVMSLMFLCSSVVLGGVYSLLLYTKTNHGLKILTSLPSTSTPQRVSSPLRIFLVWLFLAWLSCDLFVS